MKILCATDGSKASLAGPRLLADLALDAQTDIRLLAVLERGEANPVAWQALDAAERNLAKSPARLSRTIRRGRASEQVLEVAEEVAADAKATGTDALVVVGSRGHTAIERFFLGSVAERVVRHAPCPVLIARPVYEKLDRVVVAVDGSAGSTAALEWVGRLPLPPNCEILLVAVTIPEDLLASSHFLIPGMDAQLRVAAERERESAREHLKAGVALLEVWGRPGAKTEMRQGDAASELLAVSAERHADLVVAGARGAGGFDRLLLGSVSEKLIRHAQASVLVVRTPE